jgi:hypothetical protein
LPQRLSRLATADKKPEAKAILKKKVEISWYLFIIFFETD